VIKRRVASNDAKISQFAVAAIPDWEVSSYVDSLLANLFLCGRVTVPASFPESPLQISDSTISMVRRNDVKHVAVQCRHIL
jgi:hypothetical protein